MADGKGSRWGNFTDRPKHLIQVKETSLLQRLTNQLHEADPGCHVIITARDPRYTMTGATRHVPLNNENEIDRFTDELIEDNICFLYGDTFYTDAAIKVIVDYETKDLLFFGNHRRIVAVKVGNGTLFKSYLNQVKQYNPDGKGWHVYQAFSGLGLRHIGDGFVFIEDGIQDFNTPQDYLDFVAAGKM